MFSANTDDTQIDAEKTELDLPRIKKDIETSWKYFDDNCKRYNEFYNMVFKTALSQADRETLAKLGKPPLEFPILEAYISRLRGEFAKQQPQIDVHAAEGLAIGKVDDEYIRLIKVIQAHLNEIFFTADNDEFTYDVYSDTLAGGFSVARIYTEYVNEDSFMQRIAIERVFNPTLCGFDPLATRSHKGDGRYCFELYPMTQQEFAAEFGAEKAKTFNFTRSLQGFNWSYKNNDDKIVLVGDYYVKVQRSVTLIKVVANEYTDETMTLAEYNKIVKEWDRIEQIPKILEKRKSTTTRIDRYRICQNEILEHEETFYPMLPLIFFDGNSVMLKNEAGGVTTQFTKPYVYNAKGIQRLKNFAGQTVGQELEDLLQWKLMIPVEGIPKAYEKIYQNPQIASTLAYHQFNPKQTDQRLDMPQVVQRPQTPPLVKETFDGSDATTQAILGSYDAILGVNDKQISGVAIQQGAMQSNASAVPYLMGYIKGIQRCAEVVIHLLPLIYKTPRSIPIRLPNGKRDYQIINAPYPKEDKQKKMLQKAQEMGMGNEMADQQEQDSESEELENALMFNYDPKDMNVRIEPGVNAAVQKQVAIDQLTRMMEASPTFAEFMNRQGLPTLLDNLDIRGVEGLKEMAEQFQAQMQAERQAAAGQPQDVDKIVQGELAKTQMETQAREQKNQIDLALGIAKVATEQEKLANDRLKLEIEAQQAHAKLHLEHAIHASEKADSALELSVDVMKHNAELQMQEAQAAQQPQGGQ